MVFSFGVLIGSIAFAARFFSIYSDAMEWKRSAMVFAVLTAIIAFAAYGIFVRGIILAYASFSA
jgi:hypothetical protein